jgi:hypothetical protein
VIDLASGNEHVKLGRLDRERVHWDGFERERWEAPRRVTGFVLPHGVEARAWKRLDRGLELTRPLVAPALQGQGRDAGGVDANDAGPAMTVEPPGQRRCPSFDRGNRKLFGHYERRARREEFERRLAMAGAFEVERVRDGSPVQLSGDVRRAFEDETMMAIAGPELG